MYAREGCALLGYLTNQALVFQINQNLYKNHAIYSLLLVRILVRLTTVRHTIFCYTSRVPSCEWQVLLLHVDKRRSQAT